ncbi:MAG: HAD-IIIA family hydrolase [Gammaproteobacteria bacterium]|nr:HAD-IIIA family hydrolase [Gammaproteobacteria bacterium]
MSSIPELVVLERDGVINIAADEPIVSPEAWIPIPGSLEAIARLNHAGIRVAIVTNQPAVGRGQMDHLDLNRIHAKLRTSLSRVGGHVEGIFFCPHRPEDGCACRQPAPGLLRSISFRFGLALSNVPVVVDSVEGILASQASRACPVLVATGLGERTRNTQPIARQLPYFETLDCVVESLLSGQLELC